MMIICGETGSGKSYAALRLAELLDPNFDTTKQVVFSVASFMKLLNEGNLAPESVIIFDEAGVGIPAREWHSIGNKLFNYVLQTFRSSRYVTIFTTPDFSFVDKQSRKLFHAYAEPIDINYETKEVKCIFNTIQNNAKKGEIYYKRLAAIYHNKRVLLNTITIDIPSKEICRAYEYMKKDFNKKLFKRVEKGIVQYDEDKQEGLEGRKALTVKQQQVLDLFKSGLNGVQIANKLQCNTSNISLQKERIRRKGWDV